MADKKIRQFELKMGSGPHVDRSSGDRIVYEPGEVIHTTQDLNTLFPHKFIELGITKKATIKKKQSKLRPSSVKEKPETEENPTSIENEDDEKIDDEEVEEEEDKTAPPRSPKFGKDVTKDFEDAVKADLKVYKRKKGYTVVDADEPTKALSSTKAKLKSPSQVGEWIAKYRKGG